MREPIPPGERLAVTLRFLATGESFASLQYQFRISSSALSVMIPEVCEAIYNVLQEDYLKCPKSAEEWRGFHSYFKIDGNCHIVLVLQMVNILRSYTLTIVALNSIIIKAFIALY